MTDAINGWTPPLLHDLSTGTSRIATQADVDELVMIREAYGSMRRKLRDAEHEHEMLKDRLRVPPPLPVP